MAKNGYLLIAAAWLITISFIIDNYWSGTSTPKSVQRIIQRDIQKKQTDFEAFSADTGLIIKLASQQYNEAILQKIQSKNYFIFIYSNDEFKTDSCVFWSTQVVQPDSAIHESDNPSYITKLLNGWYVINKKTITSHGGYRYKIISLIPVKWDYYISNNYLNNSFAALKNIEDDYDISLHPGNININGKDGNTLFYLQPSTVSSIVQNNIIAIWLKVLAAILVLIFIHIAASFVVIKKDLLHGFLALFIPVIVIRVLSYFIPIPFNLRQLELFDPSIYGSNFILRSLGDLLINSSLFVWFILFVRFHLKERLLSPKPIGRLKKIGFISGITVAMILVTFLCGHIIRSLVADSQISFDVINFFTLSFYSIVGFIVLCCIATGYFFLFQILSYSLIPFFRSQSYVLYIALSVLGLMVISFRLGSPYVLFNLLLLLWLLVFVFLMDRNYRRILAAKIILSRYLFWILFFSVSITAIIVFQNKNKELGFRKHFAENLSNKADPASERMMNLVLTDLRNDFLSNVFNRFKNKSENTELKDSLVNANFLGYLNKYDTRIYTFNAREKPLFNEDSTTFSTLNTVIETQAKSTGTPGLYYYDVSYDRFNYISKKEVTDEAGNTAGYVFILSNPKKYKIDALYPELFSKGNANSIENSTLYAFAVYNKNRLTNSHNDYPFPTQIARGKFMNNEFHINKRNGYDELWYRANEDKVIVITKPDSFFYRVYNFVCVFILFFSCIKCNIEAFKYFSTKKI